MSNETKITTMMMRCGESLNERNYLINSIRNFKPSIAKVQVDCLDACTSFDTISKAAEYAHVTSDKLIRCMKNNEPVNGHIFIRHEDNYRDRKRYMNYCYTKSEIYSDLADELVYTLSDKAVVLLSGGVDSTTCLALAISEYGAENVTAVSSFYGQRHEKELACARKIADYYNVKHLELNLSSVFSYSNCSLLGRSTEAIPTGSYKSQLHDLEAQGSDSILSTVVPFRNAVMLSAATSLAMSLYPDMFVDIYLGNHADDANGHVYADCTREFIEHMRKAIKEGSYNKVYLVSPFVNSTKADIVRIGLSLNVPYQYTYSCYKGGKQACGKCGTCIDRANAFKANGIEDPAVKGDE